MMRPRSQGANPTAISSHGAPRFPGLRGKVRRSMRPTTCLVVMSIQPICSRWDSASSPSGVTRAVVAAVADRTCWNGRRPQAAARIRYRSTEPAAYMEKPIAAACRRAKPIRLPVLPSSRKRSKSRSAATEAKTAMAKPRASCPAQESPGRTAKIRPVLSPVSSTRSGSQRWA